MNENGADLREDLADGSQSAPANAPLSADQATPNCGLGDQIGDQLADAGRDGIQPRAAPQPMQIKRLKLSGFKSFVEPATLYIEPGLTGVVGPNGCGKSNLLEAIRWVMGESAPKSMRSGGMEDVIFAGTDDRPARNFAEVTLLAEVSHSVLGAIGADPLTAKNSRNRPVRAEPVEGRPTGETSVNIAELEVVRRIERGAGSAYRANGRDVRAKDVALIFADAATGAHSPALVSQGKIAAVIAAKPAARRQMLEEAAGISGLHVRRKDAEQKLRATATNLERLQQILSDMEQRANSLRKQAAAAERYRLLSGQISTAEARAIFARWRDAAASAHQARAEAEAAIAQVTTAQKEHDAAIAAHQAAISAAANARNATQQDRDRANALSHELLNLQNSLESTRRQISDLSRQTDQITHDSAREDRLTHDATDALAALEAEAQALAASIAEDEKRLPEIAQNYDRAERATRQSDLEVAHAEADQARADADIKMAGTALSAAQARADRCERDYHRIEQQLTALGNAAKLAQYRDQALQEKDAAMAQRAKARDAVEALEAQRAPLAAARETQESARSSARADLNTLTRQLDALQRDLAAHQGGDQILDQLRPQKGYEKALAAALGDDLRAAIAQPDSTLQQGRFWTHATDIEATNVDLPAGTQRLSDYVSAPDLLLPRLNQIFVADSDDGQILAIGQRLVTRNGQMRRWDGFIADGDGASAAEQLAQRNRRDSLLASQPIITQQAEDAADDLRATEIAIKQLKTELTAALAAHDAALAQERDALRVLDQAEFAVLRDTEKRDDLLAQMELLTAERETVNAELIAAQKGVDALPDTSLTSMITARLKAENTAAKQALRQAQTSQSTLDQNLAASRERRAVVRAEIKGWQARATEAESRNADMRKRGLALAEARAAIGDRPAQLEQRIKAQMDDQAMVSARLAALQTKVDLADAALQDSEKQLAITAETLATSREARAGAAARAEHQDQRRGEMAHISGERFQCPPALLPERNAFDADDVRDAEAETAQHDQLVQARERLGAVNLIAADELAEMTIEMARSSAEHDELYEAVNQLRGSIGALNREGRQRLLTAFAAVDGHFQILFARLFNGGKAHLELVDSDDPLEAGLEIMAQPPGKRLSSLTLLSGGEQALTAVALIFGLFLTNPAPICVLDEVDAPLDDANIERFCDLLDFMVAQTRTRYLIVTHNAVTMSRMHRLFGVTMMEKGVSRLVSVDLGAAEELLGAA